MLECLHCPRKLKNKTMKSNERVYRIAVLRQELFKLEKEQNEFNELSPVQQIATMLHDKKCSSNHEDQCTWFYDTGNWQEYSRKEYLEKAKKVLALAKNDLKQAIIMIDVIA